MLVRCFERQRVYFVVKSSFDALADSGGRDGSDWRNPGDHRRRDRFVGWICDCVWYHDYRTLVASRIAAAFGRLCGISVGFLIGLCIGAMIVGRAAAVAGVFAGAGLGYFLSDQLPITASIVLAVVVGIALAYLAIRFTPKIPLSPFIVTLGMWGALRGAAKGLGDNQPVYPAQTWITDSCATPTMVYLQSYLLAFG